MTSADQDRSDDGRGIEAEAFRSLMEKVRAGDDAAAAELVRQYEPEIRRFVRLRLAASSLRTLLDSVDVSQSVLAQFFEQLTASRIEVRSPRQLLHLLGVMARNRLVDHLREHNTIRRGGHNRQESLESTIPKAITSADPSDLAERHDLVEAVRAILNEADRQLLDYRLLGYEWNELAQRFGQNPEALRKRYARAIDRAARRLGLLESDDE